MSHTESRRAVKRREALNTFYYYRGDCELVILVSSLRRWSFCNHTLVFVWSLYFWSDCDLRCVFVVWATWKAPDYQPFVCFCQWGFLESCLVTFHKNTRHQALCQNTNPLYWQSSGSASATLTAILLRRLHKMGTEVTCPHTCCCCFSWTPARLL